MVFSARYAIGAVAESPIMLEHIQPHGPLHCFQSGL
jgi:hypothetical protein